MIISCGGLAFDLWTVGDRVTHQWGLEMMTDKIGGNSGGKGPTPWVTVYMNTHGIIILSFLNMINDIAYGESDLKESISSCNKMPKYKFHCVYTSNL